jgi:hypothetical protein
MSPNSKSSPRPDGATVAVRHALKGEGRRIVADAAQRGDEMTLSAALEEVARRRGFRDWNSLSSHVDRGGDVMLTSAPFPPSLRILSRYAQHIVALGPLESYFESVPTSSLSGLDLDFAVAASVANEGDLVVDFLPSLRPHQVMLQSGRLNEPRWNPASNALLAEQLLARTSFMTEGELHVDALRNLVRSKYGDNIDVVRLRRAEH